MIKFENVGLRYGLGPEILSDLSFQIPPHSFQFLTGPSGAGKTTLMRLLSLSLRPSRGFMSLFGADVTLLRRAEVPSMRRRIGVVFQDFRLLDHLSTFDNVALPLRIQGREAHTYRGDVNELLRWVGLSHRSHAFPPVLSGGEKVTQGMTLAAAKASGANVMALGSFVTAVINFVLLAFVVFLLVRQASKFIKPAEEAPARPEIWSWSRFREDRWLSLRPEEISLKAPDEFQAVRSVSPVTTLAPKRRPAT